MRRREAFRYSKRVQEAINDSRIPQWKSASYNDFQLHDDMALQFAVIANGQGSLPNLAWLRPAPVHVSELPEATTDYILAQLDDQEASLLFEKLALAERSATHQTAPGWRRVDDETFAQYGPLEDRRPA